MSLGKRVVEKLLKTGINEAKKGLDFSPENLNDIIQVLASIDKESGLKKPTSSLDYIKELTKPYLLEIVKQEAFNYAAKPDASKEFVKSHIDILTETNNGIPLYAENNRIWKNFELNTPKRVQYHLNQIFYGNTEPPLSQNIESQDLDNIKLLHDTTHYLKAVGNFKADKSNPSLHLPSKIITYSKIKESSKPLVRDALSVHRMEYLDFKNKAPQPTEIVGHKLSLNNQKQYVRSNGYSLN